MDSLRVGCIPDLALLFARLQAAVSKTGSVRPFTTSDDAIPAIARGEVHVTVISINASTFDRDIGNIRRVRDAFAGHPIVVWCEVSQLSSRQLLDIAEFGVADMAFRGVTDSRHAFAQLLSRALQRTSTRQLDSRLSYTLPESIRPFFLIALERAAEPIDVKRAAAALGVTRRTLRNRMAYHGLPLPGAFLVWCRLLVAGTMLDERGRTLDSVAMQLNYSSGQNLGAALRRYVGANITTLRQGDVSPAVEREFTRVVSRGRARASEARTAARANSLPTSSSAD